jgi:bifunctional UDP-N-acetylglucosamine pyrophosphorylase/glucosamine-1-phosphate N-acetyltransferase
VAFAFISTDAFLESQSLCGLEIHSFFARLGAQSNLQLTQDLSQAELKINGHYPALLPATLNRALNDRRNLFSSSGESVLEWLDGAESAHGEPLAPYEDRAVIDFPSLIAVEAVLRSRLNANWITRGVHIIDPQRTYIDASVELSPGVKLWPGVVLRGATSVGANTEIQAGCWIQDSKIGRQVVIKPHSVCDHAQLGDDCSVGPMAHLRPGALLKTKVKVGNFVEIKRSVLESGAKAAHLSYIGDASVGSSANIGAGTITCNYDGHGKHRTEIGDRAFIGSNTALVAPVRIGEGAIIGAGSTISRDVPKDALAVERSTMRLLENKAPSLHERNRLRAAKVAREP